MKITYKNHVIEVEPTQEYAMSYDHWKTTEPDDYPGDEWKHITDWTEQEKADYEDWLDERQWRLDNGIPTFKDQHETHN